MDYIHVKKTMMDLFDPDKLQLVSHEWGFFNETGGDVRRLGYAVNLTESIIRQAGELKIDLLLTHHDSWEFVFGLKESCNQLLQELEIAHVFFHAPLDDADFGTSASLAGALGLSNRQKVMPYAQVYESGVIGSVEPIDFASFAQKLTGILQEQPRCLKNNDKCIRKVAVAAGGGNMTNEMRIAAEHGCDTYVTGEYALYSQLYAEHVGMNLFVGSHTNTEILGVEAMAELVCRNIGNTGIEVVRIMEPNY